MCFEHQYSNVSKEYAVAAAPRVPHVGEPRQVWVDVELAVTLPSCSISWNKHVGCYHLIIMAPRHGTSMGYVGVMKY